MMPGEHRRGSVVEGAWTWRGHEPMRDLLPPREVYKAAFFAQHGWPCN